MPCHNQSVTGNEQACGKNKTSEKPQFQDTKWGLGGLLLLLEEDGCLLDEMSQAVFGIGGRVDHFQVFAIPEYEQNNNLLHFQVIHYSPMTTLKFQNYLCTLKEWKNNRKTCRFTGIFRKILTYQGQKGSAFVPNNTVEATLKQGDSKELFFFSSLSRDVKM